MKSFYLTRPTYITVQLLSWYLLMICVISQFSFSLRGSLVHLMQLFAFLVRQFLIEVLEVRFGRSLLEEVDKVRLGIIVQLMHVPFRLISVGH